MDLLSDPTIVLANAIAALRPNAQWSLRGPTLADLEWHDTEQSAPTQAEVDAQLAKSTVPVPQTISDRQFFQQLAVAGIVSQADALAAVKTGTIPAPLQAIVNAMPTDQQFAAEMIISGATIFQRSHPMTIAIGTAYGWTPDQTDAFFIAAALL